LWNSFENKARLFWKIHRSVYRGQLVLGIDVCARVAD